MEKKLLFINHREEEIQAFTEAMQQNQIIVDTADNGIDAALLIKKNTYGVIILDMNLKGYDGEQLIKFLNQVYPNTVCIVYTVALTQGQLSFLVNKRNIFHVFLSPAKFKEEFLPMIEEGFMVYEINSVNAQEECELEEKYQERERELIEKSKILDQQKKETQLFLEFSRRVVEETLRIFGKGIEEKEKRIILAYEKGILKKAQEVLNDSCHGFEDMEQMLRKEYIENYPKRELHFNAPQYVPGQLGKSFYESIYTVLWGLLKYFSAISEVYTLSIRIEFETSSQAVIMLIITLPTGTWERYKENQISEQYKHLTQYVAESLMDSYMRVINDDLVSYRMELDLEKKKL